MAPGLEASSSVVSQPGGFPPGMIASHHKFAALGCRPLDLIGHHFVALTVGSVIFFDLNNRYGMLRPPLLSKVAYLFHPLLL